MSKDVARVGLTCRLTRDPELRHTPSGMAVADLRVAWTSSRKGASGDWEDKPNYIDVTVWGRQGEVACEYLAKGRRIFVDGRLEWREWEAQDGTKRQAHSITCENLVFLEKGDQAPGTLGSAGAEAAGNDFVPAGAGAADDDIPFRNTPFYPMLGVRFHDRAPETLVLLRELP